MKPNHKIIQNITFIPPKRSFASYSFNFRKRCNLLPQKKHLIMKKVVIVILVLLVVLVGGFLLYMGAPYDQEKSVLHEVEVPENINRTIENHRAENRTTFLEKSDETGGEYSLLEIELGPGGENILHYHDDFTEEFTVRSGTLGLHLNGTDSLLEPGESALVERGDDHYFFNPSEEDTVRFEVKIEPGSPGFEKALYILYGIINDGLVDDDGIPENIYHTALFIELSDTRSPERSALFNWFVSRMAGRAQRNGVEEELIERYYLHNTKDASK